VIRWLAENAGDHGASTVRSALDVLSQGLTLAGRLARNVVIGVGRLRQIRGRQRCRSHSGAG
jgi:hypothetical protein